MLITGNTSLPLFTKTELIDSVTSQTSYINNGGYRPKQANVVTLHSHSCCMKSITFIPSVHMRSLN